MTADNAGAKGAIPEKIGRYKVMEKIGHGAMGLVYRARDEAMGREVAIKLLVTDLEDEPEVRARFAREAEAAARLSQPNIITIFDVGEDRGRFYIVMELLRGLTLKEFLEQKQPTLDRKLDLMIQLCAGLSAAHSEGIYHRDIKPGNLFVRNDGILKILDFGVARLSSSNMTSAGLVVGTPDYMSPEQARGLPIDGRSDIFSAGGVFYLMLTGRKPFEARDLPTIFRKIQSEQPRALSETEAPPELARVIDKMLVKDRAHRYQNCQELSADLTEVKRLQALAASGVGSPSMSIPIPPTVMTPPSAVPSTVAPPPPTHSTPPIAVPIAASPTLATDETPPTPIAVTPAPPAEPPQRPKITVSTTDATILMTPSSLGRSSPAQPTEHEEATKWVPSRDDSEVTSYPFSDAKRESDTAARRAEHDTEPAVRQADRPTDPAVARTRVTAKGSASGSKADDDSGPLDDGRAVAAAAPVPHAPKGATTARPVESADAGVAATKPLRPALPSKAQQGKPAGPPIALWATAAIIILAVLVLGYLWLRPRPEPAQTPPPPNKVEAPAPAPPAPTVDTAAQQTAQDLAAAKEQIARGDFAGAINDHLQPLLARDPQNSEAAALKTEAEAAIAKATAASPAAPATRPPRTKEKDTAADVKLVAGISRLPNESAKDYGDRADRVQARYARGKQELEQKHFGAAIESFQVVERDQPNYLEVRSLLADASTQRSAAYRDAMDRGAKAESAGQLMAAYQAYHAAEQFDTTLSAAEKSKGVRERLAKDGAGLLDRAATFEKMRRPADAIKLYQQVVDTVPEGEGVRDKAAERLKVLKP